MEIDIHLSAEEISKTSIEKLISLGFVRDVFTNNRRCEATAFHASYFKHLYEFNDALWESTIKILKNDTSFRGCLEEEYFDTNSRCEFDGNSVTSDIKVIPFELARVEIGRHKACDIHVSIDFNQSTESAKSTIESFKMISFDRPLDHGFKRVYSLTFEKESDGTQAFDLLKSIFTTIPGLVGKMKIEMINRFYVQPESAIQLPIVRHESLNKWLSNYRKYELA